MMTDADLARYVLHDTRQKTGASPVYWGGSLFKYSPERGVWDVWSDIMAKASIQDHHHGLHKVTRAKMEGALEVLKVLTYRADFFMQSVGEYGITFRNGFLRVTEQGTELVPHTPEQRSRFGYGFDYDPLARPARYLKFLSEVWPEPDPTKHALFQEFVGAALLGVAYQFEKAVLFHGKDGQNGKSVVLAVISALFPDGTRSAIPPQKWSEDYFLAQLVHSRANIMADIPESEFAESSNFKAVISGDELMARPIRQAPIKFRPIAAHIFSMNKLAPVRAPDPAFWRRWMVFPFNVRFDTPARKDELIASLIDELPAIVTWAVTGAARLLAAKRYTDSPSCVAALDAWKLKADQVAAFLNECTIRDEGASIVPRDLYNLYREWTFATGHSKLAESSFRERLAALSVKLEKVKGAFIYRLAIKEETDGVET